MRGSRLTLLRGNKSARALLPAATKTYHQLVPSAPTPPLLSARCVGILRRGPNSLSYDYSTAAARVDCRERAARRR